MPAGNLACLSDRQLEILRLLGQGKGTLDIAELLGISPSTTRNHIQRLLGKLKVHNRLEAVTLARRIGLV
jgi:DNA-binding CsgD family transcriptional regulator